MFLSGESILDRYFYLLNVCKLIMILVFGIWLSTATQGWQKLLLSKSLWRASAQRLCFIKDCLLLELDNCCTMTSQISFQNILSAIFTLRRILTKQILTNMRGRSPALWIMMSPMYTGTYKIPWAFKQSVIYSVMFWQIIYLLIVPFIMIKEVWIIFPLL